MNLTEFTAAVKERLQDSTSKLMPAAGYTDQVKLAVIEFSRDRPRRRRTSLVLQAGIGAYGNAAADFMSIFFVDWGRDAGNPRFWERERTRAIGQVPNVWKIDEQLYVHPAPTAEQIAAYGSAFPFFYNAAHVVTDATSTIPAADDPLVVLLSVSRCCKEIAAAATQGDPFANRYYRLAKLYKEQYDALIGNPRPTTVRE